MVSPESPRAAPRLRGPISWMGVVLAFASCGGTYASRGAPPPIPRLLPAPPPESARPINVPDLRCVSFDGKSTRTLERAVAHRAHAVQSCYRASVAAGMRARGILAIDLAIAEDGEVLGATVRDTHPSLDRVGACVADAFRDVRLPPPESGCLRFAWAVEIGDAPSATHAPAAETW